jgi:hypothetical protein
VKQSVKIIFFFGLIIILSSITLDSASYATPSIIYQSLSWNTFIGIVNIDAGRGVAVDGGGNIYVTGTSQGTWGTPIDAHAGSIDAFVAKLNSSGALQWNTFMGHSGLDNCQDICVDSTNHIYVAGVGYGTWGTPTNGYAGNGDAFFARLFSTGHRQWNTFLGSSASDELGSAVVVTATGVVYAVGDSHMTWGSPEDPFVGEYDFFVAGLTNSTGDLRWHTFTGSTSYDFSYDVAQVSAGSIYIVGDSHATWGSPILPYTGQVDPFVAKLVVPQVPDTNVRFGNINFNDGSTRNLGTKPSSIIMGREFTFTIENSGAAPLNLTDSPAVELLGPHAQHFQVSQQPTTPVEPYSSTTFKIRTVRDSLPGFLPIGWEYSVSFTINIPNDDPVKNPYDFTIEFVLKKV